MQNRVFRGTLEISDLDRRIWDEELEAFVPRRVFDTHVHIYMAEHCLTRPGEMPPEPNCWTDRPIANLDRKTLDRAYARLLPNRELHYVAFGWPFRRLNFDEVNAFTAAEMADDPISEPVMLVHPGFSAEKVAKAIERQGFRGLKPYRYWAKDEVECRITDMLPEPLIEVANEKEVFVVLHLGKKLGIADEQNIQDMTALIKRYPKVRWNLAHMARCSVAWPLERAIDRLKNLPNLWYDFSSVTNTDVFMLAFRNLALDRIMYGSDIPADILRGTLVSFGMGWALLTEKEIASINIDHCDNRCTYVMYETLRACRRAAMLAGLDRQQIEDLFFNNAFKFCSQNKPKG